MSTKAVSVEIIKLMVFIEIPKIMNNIYIFSDTFIQKLFKFFCLFASNSHIKLVFQYLKIF